ncbi:right-handed parallel beta-helix repeat-containing protein [candidate division WOR-3 bacterium]|nr:right-handed parallel beta-helix repeat-containing protein [candidate division WOR-3 bacterium]
MKSGKKVKFGKRRALIFAVIFATLAFVSVSVGCAAATTHYVNPGELIQLTVDAANPGDTIIVRDGIYTENVNVNKSLTIQSDNGSANCIVQAAKSYISVFRVTANYVNISGFTVKDASSDDGIYLSGVGYCTISNNSASNNSCGILLMRSSNNTLIHNTNNLNERGIYFLDSSNNTITNNNCSNNDYGGITLSSGSPNNILINNTANSNKQLGLVIWWEANNNTLRNNTISGNKYNFHAEGIQDIDTSNKINGKSIRYLVNEKDQVVDSNFDVGYLGIVNSRNITVRDLILINNLEGILLDHSSDSKIENVTVLNCEEGIYLKSSSNNIITNNNASNDSTGIYLQNASDNTISNNNVSNNSIGIYLWDYSNNNILTHNTVNFNSFYGIGFFNALNNNIFLNNFNNSDNVRPSGQTNTSWNSTSKITYTYNGNTYTNYMGNYWSDYNESDNDNDGIGDTSYSIDSHHDYCPLMQPRENYFAPAPSVFDTDAGTYPSIMGTHNGTITPSNNINVSTLYTYPCVGTGGHTESIKLYDENDTLIANGTWNGYQSDWHNITITPSITLLAGHTYNYTIVTGSYPQIIHEPSKNVTGGTITCDQFIDAKNGKIYTDWIPAIRLYDLQN